MSCKKPGKTLQYKNGLRCFQWYCCRKIFAYYLTHSLAILTDALESIVNVVAGFIGLYSLYIAAKPSDSDHPYGHGKAEFISAAVEGGLIVSAGLVILLPNHS